MGFQGPRRLIPNRQFRLHELGFPRSLPRRFNVGEIFRPLVHLQIKVLIQIQISPRQGGIIKPRWANEDLVDAVFRTPLLPAVVNQDSDQDQNHHADQRPLQFA